MMSAFRFLTPASSSFLTRSSSPPWIPLSTKIFIRAPTCLLSSSKHFSTSKLVSLQQDPSCSQFEEDDHNPSSHVPVLLAEVLAAFQARNLHSFVDCTLGAGGHASAMIREHLEMKTFVGLDVDPVAHSEASPRLQDAVEHRRIISPSAPDLKLHLVQTNFRNVKSVLEEFDLAEHGVDGILMDLGMSSMQLNVAERGFSLQQDGPADMRMDPLLSLKADDILNSWPEAEIGRILREYGEESQWKRLAWKISEAQLAGGIHSTSKLLEIIQKSLPLRFSGRQGWKKTAIRVFQALRIAVNDELTSLEVALSDAYACLTSKGRLAVISFHSLEDRIVKQFFLRAMGEDRGADVLLNQYLHIPGKTKYNNYRRRTDHEDGGRRNKILEGRHASVLTKRPITAGLDEVEQNRRARSAKLRILEKK